MASNLERWIIAVAPTIQKWIDAMRDLFVKRTLEDAIGDQLAQIGQDFNEPALDSDDEDYRARIKAKIICLAGSGTTEDIYSAMREYDPLLDFHIERLGNKTFHFIVDDMVTQSKAQKIARIVNCSAAAGENSYTVFHIGTPFILDDSPLDDAAYVLGGAIGPT